MASQFLVFMLVSLDGLWHQLIGYWFTNHVNADNLYQSSNQQIKYIMRKLIVIKCGGLSTSLNMNCSTVHVDFEFVESDSVPENFMETIIAFSGQLTHQPDSVHAPVLDNFKRRVLCFIGGYIVKKLLPHVTCKECKAALVNNVEDPLDTADERLIQLKNGGERGIAPKRQRKPPVRSATCLRSSFSVCWFLALLPLRRRCSTKELCSGTIERSGSPTVLLIEKHAKF